MRGLRLVSVAFVPLVLLALALPASAQMIKTDTFGVKGGLAVSTAAIDIPDFEVGYERVTGMTAGVFFGVPVRLLNPLDFQTELNVTRKGSKYNAFGFDQSLKLTYLEIPLLVAYDVKVGRLPSIRISGGPSLAFKIRETHEEDGEDIDVPDQVKTFDFGLSVGGAYSYRKFIAEVRYTHGLLNVADQDAIEFGEGVSAKNRSLAITLGYRFW